MHKYLSEYPPAPPFRAREAEALFPYRTMTAEEYAAREGWKWACFSFGEYVYENAALNEWIHELDDIFFTPGQMDEARRRHLSAEEIAKQMESERSP